MEKSYGYNADGDIEHTTYKVAEQELKYTYETDNTPDKRNSKVSLPFGVEQNLAYDGLGRTKEISLTDKLVKDIYYAKYGDHATNRVNSVWHGVNGIRKDNTKYTYDKAGNISTVTENGVVTRYVYDGLNRLIREDNPTFGKITYEYDNAGNILCKTVRGKKYRYTYPQNGWKDQLLERSYKEYDGTEVVERFVYDVLGNPTIYRNKSLLWQGRRLKQLDNTSFTYDVNGIRTSKVHNSILTKYIYDGNNLVAEQRNNEWIYYIYGVDGVAGFNYDGKTYLYRKNVQGDVTHIYKQEEDKSLTLVVEYVYDAWGNIQVLQDTDRIATLNPFRYRSYYFDEESKFYYLQTRYYDPELGRFISADSIEYLDPETLGGLNLYAYCGNNPVMGIDPEGNVWWNPFSWNWGNIGKVIGGGLLALAGAAVTLFSLPDALVRPGAGFITQIGFSMMMYGGFVVGSVFDSQINADMEAINWNPFNPDAGLAASSKKVSFYQGVPVIRVDLPEQRSGSFLGIWLVGSNSANTIKHEWGHTIQQGIMGWAKYLTMVGLPSWKHWGQNKWHINKDYYVNPWDGGADYFGGVAPRNDGYHTMRTRADEVRAIWYLVVSTLFWPAGYFFLI